MELLKKKIVVTGGAGFLGTHVVAALIARGCDPKDIIVPRAEERDLRDLSNCREIVTGVDLVIHLAGITGDAVFHKSHPGQIFYDNLTMGVQLMEAAREAGVKKFITTGSATEYPENAPLPLREDNLWAGAPEELHAPYTVAKKMLLVQAQAYRRQYGWNGVHLLLTNMYGPGYEAQRGFVIANTIERILNAKKNGESSILMWGSGTPTRDFLYVKDAAEGIVLAAERYDKGEPVNLGSGWEVSIKELTETIVHLMDYKGEIKWDTTKPDGVMRRMLDTSRAEQEFGFKAKTPLGEGIAETIRFHESRK